MKRIKLNFAILAILLGTGLALAAKPAHHHFNAPNYYNTGTLTVPIWVPLTRSLGSPDDPGTYSCASQSNYCTAYFSSPPSSHQIPTDYEAGKYTENN